MLNLLVIYVMTSLVLLPCYADGTPGPFAHVRSDSPKKADATTGRYLYVGPAPTFKSSELEAVVSKMGLTLRVDAWISTDLLNNYANKLHQRWMTIDKALSDPNFKVYPLARLAGLAKDPNDLAWAKIAEQYSRHVLEDQDLEVYSYNSPVYSFSSEVEEKDYRLRISTAILRYYFNDKSSNRAKAELDSKDLSQLIDPKNSQRLLQRHFGHKFTASSKRENYVGYISFVYPIAATVKGPFDQPAEGIHSFIGRGSVNARWWSNLWTDQYGGLPFLLVTEDGVAFHGPISNYSNLDVWFLRRGYVSHGCHRMDTSDIMELRKILPKNMDNLSEVKLTVLDNFDVVDPDEDGKFEVVDVKYYNIPTSFDLSGQSEEEALLPYKVENQQKTYFQEHSFAASSYDAEKDIIKETAKYEVVDGQLTKAGVLNDLPIKRFKYEPNRILQYTEPSVPLEGFDDNQGNYAPESFFQEQ